MKISKLTYKIVAGTVLALSVTACGFDSNPTQCGASTGSKGEAIARKSIIRFLRYAGKTHSPISGDGGTLDFAKLEHLSDSDLIYDGRDPRDINTYTFHLQWAPNATFTGAVATNCSVTTNWAIK